MAPTCVICTDNVPQSAPAFCTHHSFCNECFIRAVDLAIQSERHNPPGCCRFAKPCNVREFIDLLGNDRVTAFEAKQAEYKTLARNRIYCANPKCSKFLNSAAGFDASQSQVKCVDCGFVTCKTCKIQKEENQHVCGIKDIHDEHAIQKLYNEGYKRCPSCRAFIFLTEACNHMTCAFCRHQFCFICLRRWQDTYATHDHHCPESGDPAARHVKNGYFRGFHLKTGLDKDGYDWYGFNEHGFDREGKKRGEPDAGKSNLMIFRHENFEDYEDEDDEDHIQNQDPDFLDWVDRTQEVFPDRVNPAQIQVMRQRMRQDRNWNGAVANAHEHQIAPAPHPRRMDLLVPPPMPTMEPGVNARGPQGAPHHFDASFGLGGPILPNAQTRPRIPPPLQYDRFGTGYGQALVGLEREFEGRPHREDEAMEEAIRASLEELERTQELERQEQRDLERAMIESTRGSDNDLQPGAGLYPNPFSTSQQPRNESRGPTTRSQARQGRISARSGYENSPLVNSLISDSQSTNGGWMVDPWSGRLRRRSDSKSTTVRDHQTQSAGTNQDYTLSSTRGRRPNDLRVLDDSRTSMHARGHRETPRAFETRRSTESDQLRATVLTTEPSDDVLDTLFGRAVHPHRSNEPTDLPTRPGSYGLAFPGGQYASTYYRHYREAEEMDRLLSTHLPPPSTSQNQRNRSPARRQAERQPHNRAFESRSEFSSYEPMALPPSRRRPTPTDIDHRCAIVDNEIEARPQRSINQEELLDGSGTTSSARSGERHTRDPIRRTRRRTEQTPPLSIEQYQQRFRQESARVQRERQTMNETSRHRDDRTTSSAVGRH